METNNTTTSNGVHNTHTKDNAAKIVFGDPVLCAQFLKGYTDIPLFKEIKPEDSVILYLSGQIMPRNRKSYIKVPQNLRIFFIHQSCLSYITRGAAHGLHR